MGRDEEYQEEDVRRGTDEALAFWTEGVSDGFQRSPYRNTYISSLYTFASSLPFRPALTNSGPQVGMR